MHTITNIRPYTRTTLFITSSYEMAASLGKQHSTIVRHIQRLIEIDPGWSSEFDEHGDNPQTPWFAMSYDAAGELVRDFRRK